MHKLKNDPISNDDVVNKKYVDNAIKDNNIKTYTSLDQLGLTDHVAVGDIYNAMPDGSLAIIQCNEKATSVTDVPTEFGMLTIEKNSTSKFSILYKRSMFGSAAPNELYIGQLKGSDGTELSWSRVCTTSDTDIHVTTGDKAKWNEVDNKVDKTSVLSAISNTPSDYNLLSEKAIKSELDKLKTNFEDGVDTVYDAVVARGTTPIDKTPSEIADAISKLGGDLTSIYNALTNKGLNMSGTESDDQIASIINDLMTIKSFTTQTDTDEFVFNGTKDTIKDTELVDTIDAGLILEITNEELTSVESGGYIEFAEIDKAEYNNLLKFV